MPKVSLAEFARLFELTPQRVSTLVKDGLPATPAKHGRAKLIDVRAGHEWLLARAVARAAGPGDGESLRDAETRLARAQADISEAKLAARRAELVPREVATAALAACLRSFDAATAQMAARLAPAVAAEGSAAAVRQMVLEATRRARARMADDLDGGEAQP